METKIPCPFRDPPRTCQPLSAGAKTAERCESDDHDTCPTFLTKALLNAQRLGGRYGAEFLTK